MGPNTSAGRNTSALTMMTMPISSPTNAGVSVSSDPRDSGLVCLLASSPAMASCTVMGTYRPSRT